MQINRYFLLLVILCSVFQAQGQFKGDKCLVKTEFIYQPQDVKFPACHASTISEIRGGFIAAWFGGTAEKNPDVGIWTSRYLDGKWSKPVEVANGVRGDKRYPCWNPVLYYSGEELLLFYKVGPAPDEWWGELIISDDEGISWSPSKKLPEGFIGPVKNKPILLDNGTLLCPSSTEDKGWRVHMEMTPDFGISWEKTPPLNDRSIEAIQPTILLHKSGKLQILCRSEQLKILTAWSSDNGKQWTGLEPTELPNPNSGIDAVTMKDGRHLLVYNHLTSGRNVLNIALSEDGINWQAAAQIENDAKGKEFSYPAIIQSNDGMIHITYTWNRKLIKHVVLDPSLIEGKPFVKGSWPSE